MTYPTSHAGPPPMRRKLSIASLLSFIFGILICIPFISGALAVVLGIIGLGRTANAVRSGRWMAIIGLILGIASVLAWGGVATFGGGIWKVFHMAAPVRVAAHDFIRDAANGNDVAAKAETSGMADADYDRVAADIRSDGKFIDTTFFSSNITNNAGHVVGFATFQNAAGGIDTLKVAADLQQIDGTWKVESMSVSR